MNTQTKRARRPNRLQWARIEVVAYPPRRAVYYFRVKRAGCNPFLGWALTGTARALFETYHEQLDPLALGVLLDRLQECPEEAQHSITSVVLEAIDFIRASGGDIEIKHTV